MNARRIRTNNKIRLKGFKAIVTCCALITIGTVKQALAIDIYAKGVVGVDTNPHELSDVHLPTQQEYAYADFKLSADYDEMFYVKGYAKQANYINDERASWYQSKIELAFKSDFIIKQNSFDYAISANQMTNDETYVSKSTGLVATYNDESLADRFDSTSNHIEGLLSYKTKQNTTFKLRYQTRDKSFEALEIDDLSNLDYKHVNIGLDIDYFVSERGNFFADTSVIKREYVDRRAKDLEGLDVIDSNLVFDYLDFEVGYLFQPEKDVQWKYTFKYTSRTDNDSGYWNADSGFISIFTKYNLSDYHILSAKLKYSKFSYENELDEDSVSLDEQSKEKLGFSLEFDYQWILATLYKTQLGLYASVKVDAFASSNELNEYQRNDLAVGIRWSL